MAGPWEQFQTVEQGPWSQFAPVQPLPEEKESAFRQVADVPLGVAKGAVQGVRMLADVFGAGSETSNTIKSAETYLAGLMSAQAKNDQQEIARIMKEAEDKGVLDQVKAGIKAFTIAPVDTLSSALGTAAPVVAASLGATVLGAPAVVGTGVGALLGAGMGAGVVKGSIYEETKKALIEAGAAESEAEQKAQLAQSYGGKNLDQILLGTALGGVAAVGPLEKGAAGILARNILGKAGVEEAAETAGEQAVKGALRRRAEAGLLEAVPEAVQAGQEQVAQNIALQREGFDVPTFRGAVSAATLEAIAGGGLGATVGGGAPEVAKPEVETIPPVAPEAAAPEVVTIPPEPPEVPAITYSPDPLISFPDGTVARKGEYETYIASLPEEQQVEARAKMIGMGQEAVEIKPEMLTSLGIKPRASIIQRLTGVEITDPKVVEELTEFAKQPYASPQTRGNIFGFLATIKPKEVEETIKPVSPESAPEVVSEVEPQPIERPSISLPDTQTETISAVKPSVISPSIESPVKPDYSSMTLEQLENEIQNANTTNLQLDVNSIKKYMGEQQANAYESMTPRQRDKWWNANVTEDMENESSVFRGVNEETISEYINAFNAFDTESPQSLGRSVALLVKDINNPEFVGSSKYLTLKNALAYAKEQNWNEKEVLDAMRSRATEWAGNDATELFKDLFKSASNKQPEAGALQISTEQKPAVEQPKTLEEFRERMPVVFDKAEVREANNEGNFSKLTKALQLSTNPAIQRIGQLGENIKAEVKLLKPKRMAGASGMYLWNDDTIQMIPSHAGNEHTNAHETLHALLSRAQLRPTEKQKPVVAQIESLFLHVKKELRKKGISFSGKNKAYGLKNVREFTAEAMTNPAFQYELMQIPYAGRKNAWTQFVQLVSNLLGIKDTNALTEVMQLVDTLAQTKRPSWSSVSKDFAADFSEIDSDQAPIAPPPSAQQVPQSDLSGTAAGGAPAKAAPAKGLTAVAGKATAKAQQLLQKQKVPTTGLSHVPEELIALAQPIYFPQNKTVLDRIDGMKDKFWQRVAQGVADQYRTIKEYSPVAYMQARISKSIDGALEGLMLHGHVFDDGGALNIKANTKGVLKALEPVGKELDSYLMWIALNRESQLPEAKRSKIQNMDKLVANRAQFAAGELNGKSRLAVYESVAREMNALNKSVLDIALKKGLINQEGYDKFSKDIYHIPFYRKMEGGDLDGAQTASGLTSQDFSKELKGGEAPFGDLMENVLRNWSHILSASMKNQAATTTLEAAMKQNAAVPNLEPGLEWKDGQVYSIKSGELVPEKKDKDGKVLYKEGELRPDLTKKEAGMAKIVKDGQVMYFQVTDPLLMEAISSIGYLGPKSKFLDVARDFKNILQFGVTLSPTFKVNNLIRDSVAAMGVSELKKNPVANVLQGISLSDPESPTYISALAGGAIFNFGSAYEGDQAKMIKRLLDKGVSRNTILDSDNLISKGLRVTWDKYQEWGNKSEAANRLALYQQMRDKGMSHLEASFKARDLLDFSMQGSWPAFRMVTQVVPFMNARIQGLYKLGRDGIIPTYRVLYNTATGKEIEGTDKQKAQAFLTITAAVGLASAVLYLAFKDDEDFKKRDQWDRDNFWWFKLPGMDVAYRVPKPFEIGAFGTLVERTLEQIFDSGAEGKQFTDSLSRTLWDTFAMNPTPQMIKPLLDIYANKDSFTGAPIESAGLERLSKQERQIDSTSFFAKVLGGVSTVFPEKFEMSPVQMDYMIKAYLGWMGGTAAVISNYATAPFREGEYPDARWLDRLSLGLAKELPTAQSKYVTAFYDSNKEISQAFADMRHYAEAGDSEKVQRILEERGDKIALAKFYDKTAKSMASVRQQINIVTKDATMGGAEKKMEIDRLKQIISTLAQQAEEVRKSMKP